MSFQEMLERIDDIDEQDIPDILQRAEKLRAEQSDEYPREIEEEEIEEEEIEGNLKQYTETIFNLPLKSTWKNIYRVNDLDFVVYSKQKIHPNLPEIEMDIYYKF